MLRIRFFSIVVLASLLTVSCHKDLDRFPTNDFTAADAYKTEAGYKQVLAKVYGSIALTSGDLAGIIDDGTSDYMRLFWKAQELSTDEAVIAWNDPGIQDFHNMNWGSTNSMLTGLYARCFYIIAVSNEFIRESDPAKVSGRGLSGAAATIKVMRAEARFVRAYAYWTLMDLYGNPGFVDENLELGAANRPQQIKRADLYTYIRSELLAIEADLPNARAAEYGRADKAAAWALMARIALNARVYTGTAQFTEAATYAKKVIDAGYALIPNYGHLALADNNTNNTEAIWTLNYDGLYTKNFGGTTFLVNASVGSNAKHRDTTGLAAWFGLRTTKNLPMLFPGYPSFTTITDRRAQFWTEGQTLEIANISEYTNGYGVVKFRNRTKANGYGQDPSRTYSDIDFPVFRLAEMYLIYAEAASRGASGADNATALGYINLLRARAYGGNSGNVSSISTDFILDERGRELYWEGHRRTDLIRFERFTENTYLWPWKGGVALGTGVSANRKLYPLPSSEIGANPNLVQNPGY
ncbi:MAG TPA: RagB/SusD family nutrient uptake outer membrane protein [Flavisolibacter sp.]|jgi:hypothetical protein|nr:RagB/SusD family nutrient uptake outer membrane protein [Flavisolibacter sp.]